MNEPNRRRITITLMLFFLFARLMPIPAHAIEANPNDLIDLEELRSPDLDWTFASQELVPAKGQLILKHDFWLMYFLHWRPIPASGDSLTLDYARQHLLNFWGPNMPFTLTGETGWTTINGHRAATVEATIYEGMIKTRFYVWNCPETGRQFTSDCNINLRSGTPERFLRIENSITQTVRCHDYQTRQDCGDLPERFVSDEFKLSFCRPSAWATSVYNSDKWFPDGPSEASGTLWTLPTNSQRRVELDYWPATDKPSATALRDRLEQMPIDTTGAEKIGLVVLRIDSLYQIDGRVRADGFLVRADTGQGEAWTTESKFSAYMWNAEEHSYLLLAEMECWKDMWGQPFDLTPSPATFETFLREELLPAVKVF